MCAGLPLVMGDVARYVRCSAVRACLFRRLPRVDEAAWAAADRWNSAIVAPCPLITVPQLLPNERVGDTAVMGPIRQRL